MVVKRRSSILLAFLLTLVPAACGDPGRDPDLFSAARSNGESANEGFRRCDSYLKG